MKQLFHIAVSFALFFSTLNAEIVKTTNIQDIREEIAEGTLVLFNVAEVLMDTETSVGSQAWRKLLRASVDSQTHDELTLFVFESVPPVPPEPATPALIKELQSQGVAVMAFTSRGRHEWYSSQVPDIDLITEAKLRQIDIDFSKTSLPDSLSALPLLFDDYYHGGIIYTGNTREKADVLVEILNSTGYQPSKIVCVDDKVDSLIALEKALDSLGIPFVGYTYTRTALNHADFNPLVAVFQTNWLLKYDELLSDEDVINVLDWNLLDY